MADKPEKKEDEKQGEKPEEKKESSKKRKLLIATDNFLPRWDGISRFLAEMIPRLKDKYDITVIAPDFGAPDKVSGFKLVKMPLSRLRAGDFVFAKPNYKAIREEIKKSDIVFSQAIGPIGLCALRAARREKKKTASFIHSIEWELATRAVGIDLLKKYSFSLTKRFVRFIYNRVSLLIAPSQSIAEMLSWHKLKSQKKIIHLGVDTKKFIPPNNKAEAKKKLGIDSETIVIGYHGRIGREKDLLTLLRAFIIVRKQFPNLALLVVGDGVESIKKKLAGVKGVILPGSTNNVVPYLQAMDIYCLPSLTETTSLGTLEAMSCGVPVIANKVGFVKDYIKPLKNGLFFTGRDSYDLSKKIIQLINDPELMKKISIVSRKFVEREFDWDKAASQLDEVFKEMIEDSEKQLAKKIRRK